MAACNWRIRGDGTPVASGTAIDAAATLTLFSTAAGDGTAGLGGTMGGRGGVEVATAISPPEGCGRFAPPGGRDSALMALEGAGGFTDGASLTVAPAGGLEGLAAAVPEFVLPDVAAG